MVYNWKNGARIKGDAQAVGEELEKIEVLNAETVVKKAKKSKGALHDCFEWDDSVAGEEYRKNQARCILRSIVITVEKQNSSEEVPRMISVRAFESVTVNDEKNMTYVQTEHALSDEVFRSQIIGRLLGTIAEAEKTMENYEYLVPSLAYARGKLQEAREHLFQNID